MDGGGFDCLREIAALAAPLRDCAVRRARVSFAR
jgi:hypothetical protein